jgi:hypothetical protein
METFVNHSTVQNNALAAELQRLGASLTSEGQLHWFILEAFTELLADMLL